jgi:hypothetical protein
MARVNQAFSTMFGNVPEPVADMLPAFPEAPAVHAPPPPEPPPPPDLPGPAQDHFPDFGDASDHAGMPVFIGHGIDSII